MNIKVQKLLTGMTLFFAITPVQALVMDFGSGSGLTVGLATPFSQAGMTMTPVDTGDTSTSFNHWDLTKGDSEYATTNDWSAAIHTGNEAEVVEFSFGGAAFDLMSFDIEGINIDTEFSGYQLIGTFTSSNGASTSVSSIGTIDFSILAGFQNITSFQFSMPLGVAGSCNVAGQNCSSMIFDNVEFSEASVVPVPATIWFFGSALLGLAGFVKRKA